VVGVAPLTKGAELDHCLLLGTGDAAAQGKGQYHTQHLKREGEGESVAMNDEN